MTTLDLDQLVIKKKDSLNDYVTIKNSTVQFTDLLDKYLQNRANDYIIRVDMAEREEKKHRQGNFDTIEIPQWMWGVLLGYILYIRPHVNIKGLPDLLLHSGICFLFSLDIK
jgi:hypothetical protein